MLHLCIVPSPSTSNKEKAYEYEEDLKWEQEQYGLADELEDLMKRDLSYRNQTSKPKLMSSSLLP